MIASGGAGGAGCCQNAGQRWCPPASGRQGTCVDYPYVCPGGSSGNSGSSGSSGSNPTPIPTADPYIGQCPSAFFTCVDPGQCSSSNTHNDGGACANFTQPDGQKHPVCCKK